MSETTFNEILARERFQKKKKKQLRIRGIQTTFTYIDVFR